MPRSKKQFEEIRKESRLKILDAALLVFAKHGYHSATVDAIAKTACISKGLLYNYFKSKEDVLQELMIGMMESLMSEYMPLKQEGKFSRDDMVNFINAGIDLVLEKPHYWKLYFSVALQPDVMSIVFTKMMELGQPYMIAMVEYFRGNGIENPEVMMRFFSAVMDGIQFHCMLDPKTFPAEEIKKLLIKQFA